MKPNPFDGRSKRLYDTNPEYREAMDKALAAEPKKPVGIIDPQDARAITGCDTMPGMSEASRLNEILPDVQCVRRVGDEVAASLIRPSDPEWISWRLAYREPRDIYEIYKQDVSALMAEIARLTAPKPPGME